MPKRSSKNQKSEGASDTAPPQFSQDGTEEIVSGQPPVKNQAAVALGKLGGLKGGKARALKLAPEKRREIARLAAVARWSKVKTSKETAHEGDNV